MKLKIHKFLILVTFIVFVVSEYRSKKKEISVSDGLFFYSHT